MQFQSDLLGIPVQVPDQEELSGIGAGYAAGIAAGIYDDSVFDRLKRTAYTPLMPEELRTEKTKGWHEAVRMIQHQ